MELKQALNGYPASTHNQTHTSDSTATNKHVRPASFNLLISWAVASLMGTPHSFMNAWLPTCTCEASELEVKATLAEAPSPGKL